MSVFYRKYQNKNRQSVAYGKWFARAVTIGKTINIDELAKHMSEHNTPYSKGAIKGVLTDMIGCIRELMLEGKAVKLDGLAIFSAGIVGIFILGLFSRRANKQGLYIGIAAAVLYTAYAVLTSTKVDIHGTGIKETILDLGDWNFTHHKYMLGVYSHLIVLVVGYVASYFFKTPLADKELTIYGYLEEKKKTQ